MNKYILVITTISLLWPMCLSTNECNRTISGEVMVFTCPSIVSSQELRLYDLTTTQLDSITSFVANSSVATSTGPFTSIPPNICLLRNLQNISFSSNQIGQVDPSGSLTKCLSNVVTLDLSSNSISQFPSTMIYGMLNLKNLYFRNNKLTEVPGNAFNNISIFERIDFSYNQLTTFELWAAAVQISADFRNNQISTITNKYFFTDFLDDITNPYIYLTNNAPVINFTDAIYEMYDQCDEVSDWFNFTNPTPDEPLFTRKLANIVFGTTQIRCSCDQYYFLQILIGTQYVDWGSTTNGMCANGSLGINDKTFGNSSCAEPTFPANSTVDFSQVYPRFCKIYSDEGGQLTNVTSNPPSSNVSGYPHYETAFLTPGACFFTFINTTTMSMSCTNDTSNTLSRFPSNLLSNPYMSNIVRVTFPSTISSLPAYLCSLPSHKIDLSFQAFTSLTDATFPCLDSFTTINLSSNQLTSVNMASGNFTTLNSLDLSSNALTMLPYSILTPTPTSLRYLDLRNNAINYIDLFLYTLKNITINLDNNPINSSNIINPQNITLANITNSSVSITFPSTVTNSTIIIDDTVAVEFWTCYRFDLLRSSLLSLRSITANVFLRCTCASINLATLYQQNKLIVTNDFPCSSATDGQTFNSLNISTCTNVISFQTGSCPNQTTQMPNATQYTTDGTNSQVPFTSTLSPSTNATTSDMSNTVAPPNPNLAVQSSSGNNSSNTGLIVGLVVGLVLGFLLIAGIIAAVYFIVKSKAAKKPVSRAKVVGRAPGDNLSSRVQPRNLRSVRLAPIKASSSELPPVPVASVAPTKASSTLSYNNSNLPPSAKGIPVRLDPIRSPSNINPQYPPNSNALNNSASFRPINNISTNQPPVPQQQNQVPKLQKPPTKLILNAGGDTRYQ